MQQPTSNPPASDVSETHARLTLALSSALGPLTAFLDDPLVVEIMLNAARTLQHGPSSVRRARGRHRVRE